MSLLDEIVVNIESIVCKDELKEYLFRNVCFVNDEDMYVIETALSQREDIDARWRKSIYAQLLKNPDEVVKGTVKELAEKYDVEMPIITEVNKVLFEGKSAAEAVIDLMVRDKKVETPMLPWEDGQ